MTRAYWQELATETLVFAGSAAFLGWYVTAKLAAWSWGVGHP